LGTRVNWLSTNQALLYDEFNAGWKSLKYTKYLSNNLGEAHPLFSELLIVINSFSRDTEAFDKLLEKVLPEL
jgi:hypothetical protein